MKSAPAAVAHDGAPVSGLGTICRIRRDRIRPFAEQPRRYFDAAGLKELARSIKAVGQQVPITVRTLPNDPHHDYELIDGQRRWLACGQLKREWMTAWVREDVTEAAEQFVASVVANFSREGHTHLEIAEAIARIRERPEIASLARGEQTEHLADIFGRSVAWVQQHESLLSLAPQVQALLHPSRPERQRLSFEIALLLTALPSADQIELAETIVARRLRGGQAKRLVRQRLHAHDGRPVGVSAQPKRVWDKCAGILHRLVDDLDTLLSTSMSHLRQAFEHRDRVERRRLLDALEAGLKQLGELRQALRRLEKGGGGRRGLPRVAMSHAA